MRSEAFDRTELPHLRTSAVLRDGDPRMPRFPDAFAAMADRERRHTRTHARTPLLAGFSCFPALCLKQRKESARRAGRLLRVANQDIRRAVRLLDPLRR